MKLIGFYRNDFDVKEGQHITGYNVYVATEIDPRRGKGVSVERVYLSDAKLARGGIELEKLLDHQIKVYYNRYGKVENIVTID